jgi:glycerate kinase
VIVHLRTLLAIPVADGGEGTVAAACASGYTEVRVAVTGPGGSEVTASCAR